MTSKYLLLKNLLSFIFIQLHASGQASPLKVLFDSVEIYYKLNCVQTSAEVQDEGAQNTN